MSVAMPAVDPSTASESTMHDKSASSSSFTSPSGMNGRVRVNSVDETDRHLAMAIHLSPLATFFLPIAIFAPLVIWLIRKDKSPFINDHGREMVNVLITWLLVLVMGVLVALITIGIGAIVVWPAILVWHVVIIINQIRAAIAASNGELFRYPMTIRLLS